MKTRQRPKPTFFRVGTQVSTRKMHFLTLDLVLRAIQRHKLQAKTPMREPTPPPPSTLTLKTMKTHQRHKLPSFRMKLQVSMPISHFRDWDSLQQATSIPKMKIEATATVRTPPQATTSTTKHVTTHHRPKPTFCRLQPQLSSMKSHLPTRDPLR